MNFCKVESLISFHGYSFKFIKKVTQSFPRRLSSLRRNTQAQEKHVQISIARCKLENIQ